MGRRYIAQVADTALSTNLTFYLFGLIFRFVTLTIYLNETLNETTV